MWPCSQVKAANALTGRSSPLTWVVTAYSCRVVLTRRSLQVGEQWGRCMTCVLSDAHKCTDDNATVKRKQEQSCAL